MISALLPQYFKDRRELLSSSMTKEEVHDFIRKNDLFINFLTQYIDTTKDLDKAFISGSKSLDKAMSTFRVDAEFNRSKARNWFKIAIDMIVCEGWNFTGVKFVKDGKSIIKTNIK